MPATPDDVLVGFRSWWNAQPEMRRLCPGGLHFGFPPQSARSPYAKVEVLSAGVETNASKVYRETFAVTVTVFGVLPDPLRNERGHILQRLDRSRTLAVPKADSVLLVKPVDAKLTPEADQRAGQNAVTQIGAWSILCQQTRIN